MAPGELRKLQKGWQGVDSQFYVMVFWLAVSSMLMFKHISNDDPQGANIFWRWGGTSGWLLLGTITQSCTGMISMHPGAAAESPRANDKAFSFCRIFLGWLSVMSDDGKWHVASEARLLDQGQTSIQGWLLKICAWQFSGAQASFWNGVPWKF